MGSQLMGEPYVGTSDPHLFRHQLITYLTKQGVISPKLQLLSGHTPEQSLAVDPGLAWSDVSTSV
jgi:integrase/recombinase XerD